MIISHKFKFIFIKTRKTAGTSVEVDLNKILGRNDVATPLFPTVEGHEARNFTFRRFGIIPRKFYNHMNAREVRSIIGKRLYDNYFVFCIEREPVDKCLSHYSMLRNSPHHNDGNENLSWDSYVERMEFPLDTEKFTNESGSLIVDRILKYEDLSNELKSVGDMLGFSVNLKARAKAGFREEIEVDEHQKKLIYEKFSSSNQFTGYSV